MSYVQNKKSWWLWTSRSIGTSAQFSVETTIMADSIKLKRCICFFSYLFHSLSPPPCRQFRRELQDTSGENQLIVDGLYRLFKKRFTVEGPNLNRSLSVSSLKCSNSISQFSMDDTWCTYLRELEDNFNSQQHSRVDKMLSPYKRLWKVALFLPPLFDSSWEQHFA